SNETMKAPIPRRVYQPLAAAEKRLENGATPSVMIGSGNRPKIRPAEKRLVFHVSSCVSTTSLFGNLKAYWLMCCASKLAYAGKREGEFRGKSPAAGIMIGTAQTSEIACRLSL